MRKLLLVLSLISANSIISAQSEEVFIAPASDMSTADDIPPLPGELVIVLESQIIENHKIVNVNIKNLITMLDMSTLEWEESMKPFEYDRSVRKDCIEYTYEKEGNRITSQVLQKCHEGISVSWEDFPKQSTVMDSLYYSLEPYYKGKNQDGLRWYGFKAHSTYYLFTLSRDSGLEFVWVNKITE